MATDPTVPQIDWEGKSSARYRYAIYPIGTKFNAESGNYVFAREVNPGWWIPIYIGHADNLAERLAANEKLRCVLLNGGTHVHVHLSQDSESARHDEEADLILNWRPVCNG